MARESPPDDFESSNIMNRQYRTRLRMTFSSVNGLTTVTSEIEETRISERVTE